MPPTKQRLTSCRLLSLGTRIRTITWITCSWHIRCEQLLPLQANQRTVTAQLWTSINWRTRRGRVLLLYTCPDGSRAEAEEQLEENNAGEIEQKTIRETQKKEDVVAVMWPTISDPSSSYPRMKSESTVVKPYRFPAVLWSTGPALIRCTLEEVSADETTVSQVDVAAHSHAKAPREKAHTTISPGHQTTANSQHKPRKRERCLVVCAHSYTCCATLCCACCVHM